ncbi:DUF3566 domain-containing protein [Mycobacterium sp.]|uniref:DUF3566 domain-containing protein n=1 Tax=Mycobacterium sp. TaxID=1785 RepID=UPI001270B25E|nr:DUF3566 domain-containing protein [Mycobacterium sp.]KAA8966489.1 MAG: hypothetical protein F6Q13_07185 [Mycobacterium sp.]
MSAPDEPKTPEPGDKPNGTGSMQRDGPHRPPAGRASSGGETAPLQRAGRPRQAQQRPPVAAPVQHEAQPAHTPGVEARLSRFVAGAAPPGATGTAAAEPEAYPSELPDLSGPVPRNPVQDRARGAATGAGRDRHVGVVQVGVRPRGPVRASMQIRRIDPWSTLKVSLVLSVALFFVWMIAVAFLYLVLGGMGVWSKLNSNVGDLLNNTSGSTQLVSGSTIFGGALLIGLVNIVLLTAMATIGAFVYNLTTDLIGGVEVTLADRD